MKQWIERQTEGRAAMRAFQLGMLRQAIRDTDGAATIPNQKRLYVISSLRMAAHQFSRCHAYREAWWTHALCRELVRAERVRTVLGTLLREVEPRQVTPAGNTGVKSLGIPLENKVRSDAAAMQSLFNRSGLADSDEQVTGCYESPNGGL
jgi:hypothetical protein